MLPSRSRILAVASGGVFVNSLNLIRMDILEQYIVDAITSSKSQ